MSDSAHVLQARRKWISLYEETGDTGLVCRRCGISWPTLRKWWCRYQQDGERGLLSNSRRPHSSPNSKVTP
jgi:transposase-like protein